MLKAKLFAVCFCMFIIVFPNLIYCEDLTQEEKSKLMAEIKTELAKKKFSEMNFGLGIGIPLHGSKYVDEASVVNGIVRVSKSKKSDVKAMLEVHQFIFQLNKHRLGIGPFASLIADPNDFIESVGAGIMFGYRYDNEKPDSVNFGIGAILDKNYKTLGQGIEENKALPAGETEIRYSIENQWGFLLFISFTF